jgi:hypothetical protein
MKLVSEGASYQGMQYHGRSVQTVVARNHDDEYGLLWGESSQQGSAHEDCHLASGLPIPHNDCCFSFDCERTLRPGVFVYNCGQMIATDNRCFGRYT